jgi:phosphatidate cytidylyltransferase
MSIFFKRVISAFFLLSAFIFTFFSPEKTLFLFLISIISLIALYELSNLLKLSNIKLFYFWAFPTISFFLFIFEKYNFNFIIYLSTFFWIFIAILSVLTAKILFKFIDFLYGLIIIFGLYISTIYLFSFDKSLLLISLSIVWLADIFAYFAGKSFGKIKLASSISPGKTLEGVYGAFIANLIFISTLSTFGDFSFLLLIILSLIIIPLSIFGDLFESLLKRNANTKDSGYLLPGHGGILDRLDGLCSTLPIVASLSLFGFVI